MGEYCIINGLNWINPIGLIAVVLMLVPNILYAIKFKGHEPKCKCCRSMYILEQIGRYGSMFLMSFNIGIAEYGFASETYFTLYVISNIVLLVAYWLIYALYFHGQSNWKSMALAIVPSCIFLIDGILIRHHLLISFALIFALSHVCITRKDSCVVD